MMETTSSKRRNDQMIFDLRRRSADAISHALFDEIKHLLPSDIQSDVARELWEAIYRNGTMIISDKESQALGLERKDQQGWTSSERVQMQLDKIALMTQMVSLVVPVELPSGTHPTRVTGKDT